MYLIERDKEKRDDLNLNLFLFYNGYKLDSLPLFIWTLNINRLIKRERQRQRQRDRDRETDRETETERETERDELLDRYTANWEVLNLNRV